MLEIYSVISLPLTSYFTRLRSTDVIHFRSADFFDGCFLSEVIWELGIVEDVVRGRGSQPPKLRPVSCRKLTESKHVRARGTFPF